MRSNIASPTIVSFLSNGELIGDGITDANLLTLDGTAVVGSLVSVYDGTTLLGTTTANAQGAWTFSTGALADGTNAFTATDSLTGQTSLKSSVETITVDPASPVIASEANTGINQEIFSGTAEADSKVTVYDGTAQLGAAMANGSGAWSFTSGTLAVGLQTFSATATDATGYVSPASQPVSLTIGTASESAGTPNAELHASTSSLAIAEPGPAALQGYNQLVFDDEFNSYSTIDMSNSHAAGYNWYLQNWFSTGATNSNDVTISNGVLQLGGGTGEAILVSAFANSSGGATGTVFGSGTYMEASIQFSSSAGANATYWPAFWGEAIQHVAGSAQMAGQPNGYVNFAEVDIMEYMNGMSSSQYAGTIHDWSGTYTSNGWQYNVANYGNNTINVGSIDWSAYHTYGLLWVPQSGNTPGHVTWYFDGQAEASIYWLGPATSASMPGITSGSFTPSSSGQAASTYSVLDSDQLALSLQTDASWPMSVDWVRVWQPGSTSVSVPAPMVTSFSPNTGLAGASATNATTLTVTGTAVASSTVLVYDGTAWLGTASANSTGAWSFTTGTLANGTHSFTATDNDAQGDTSAASAALVVTVDTVAPAAPVIVSDSTSGTTVTLTGTAEANSTVTVFEGTSALGTVAANSAGAWSYTTGQLSGGSYVFTATATDAAGNVSALSQPIDPTISGTITISTNSTSQTLAVSNDTVILSGSNDSVSLAGNGNTVQLSGSTDKVTVAGNSNSVNATGSSNTVSFSGTGNNSIALGTGTATASFAGSGNTVQATKTTLLAADSLTGSGSDTLALTGGGSFTSLGSLAHFSGFSTVTFDSSGSTLNIGNKSLTVNGTAGGNNVITLGSGTDIVNFGTGNDTVTLGTGTATVSFTGGASTVNAVIGTGATLNGHDSLTGGSGNTLALTGTGSFDLNSLAGFSGFQYVMLGGTGESLTLKSGQNLMVTAGSGNTVTLGSGVDSVIFAGGTNRINATASTLNSTDLFVGGSGSDTLAIAGSGTGASHIAAGLSSGLTSFEQLDLSGTTYVDFTLGGNNQSLTLIEGSSDTVSFSGSGNAITLGSGSATVNFTGSSTTSNTVTLGSGADSVTFANGTNTIITTNANFTSSQTIHGGIGIDTIQISGTASVVDSDFAKVTGVEALKLGGSGVNSVSVGANASADVGAGNTLTINDSAGTGSFTLNAAAMTAKVSVTGGSGSNTITGGQAADSFFGHGTDNGTNNFVYNAAALAQNSLAGNADTINNFVSGTDSFKIDYTPTNLVTVSHAGTGNLATDLASALGSSTLQYSKHVSDVALVTISGGADAGIYVVIDSAHTNGYSAAQDAVIRLVGGTDPTAAHLSHDFHT